MKKLIQTLKNKIESEQTIDLGVIILFSIVTVIFLFSFFRIYF
ncbi:MAG: hypothetical protein AB7S50_02385 [Bacteroidales bacterium]